MLVKCIWVVSCMLMILFKSPWLILEADETQMFPNNKNNINNNNNKTFVEHHSAIASATAVD